jgi:hypothetical protein
MIIFTALLIASFLSTLLDLNGQYDKIRRDWIIQRCLTPAQFNVLLPTVIIDLVFGTVSLIARKLNCSVVWIEKLHQVIWYIVYSPIILVLGLFELVKFYCKKVTLFRAR